MASWEPLSVHDTLGRITEGLFVLPVIQRRLVWEEDKMEVLFDTLLKGNSFGGIIVIEEEKHETPMFAHRLFTLDGSDVPSINSTERWGTTHYFVIDGQQRLQSFYIGLLGTYNGKELYFDLRSDIANLDFDFRFSADRDKLPKTNSDSADRKRETLWCSARFLYTRLKKSHDEDQVADEYIKHFKIKNDLEIAHTQKAIRRFYRSLFIEKSIGISKVSINRTMEPTANRQRIVELFRRLNDGGTRLSSFDLVASVLKGYEWTMEGFLDKTLAAYQDLGFGQDELLKLFFILNDEHDKEVSDIAPSDAKFVASNGARIEAALKAMLQFLHVSRLYEYFRIVSRRSTIPLYFIVYHLYHSKLPTEKLSEAFKHFDTRPSDLGLMSRWLIFSLLNGVFKSAGSGWIPYTTGIRKLLHVLKEHKGGAFPLDTIMKMYRDHPLRDFTTDITADTIAGFDRPFLFYLFYDGTKVMRAQDIDHIQPRSLLLKQKYDNSKIDSFFNFQLLESGVNRNEKTNLEFGDWMRKHVNDPESFCALHLIPQDEALWYSKKFGTFHEKRTAAVLAKIKRVTQGRF